MTSSSRRTVVPSKSSVSLSLTLNSGGLAGEVTVGRSELSLVREVPVIDWWRADLDEVPVIDSWRADVDEVPVIDWWRADVDVEEDEIADLVVWSFSPPVLMVSRDSI